MMYKEMKQVSHKLLTTQHSLSLACDSKITEQQSHKRLCEGRLLLYCGIFVHPWDSVKYLVYPVTAIQRAVYYGVSWRLTCYKPVLTNKR